MMPKEHKLIFVTLFFSLFATVTGVGIVVPLLPVFARNLGASGIYIAMIFGAFSLSRMFLLPYFGRLSDLKGRKLFIVPGLTAYALISMAFVFTESVNTLIFIRFFQGIASAMLMPVIQAYVGDITPEGHEGVTMGVFNMSMFFGLSLGPVLGGVIHDRFNMDAAFLSMGILALLGLTLSFLFLPPVRAERAAGRHFPPVSWKWLLKDRMIVGLFSYRFAYTACIGIIWGFLPVLADAELNISSAATGFLVMLGIFVSGLIHIPMGYLADRWNKKLMVLVGGFIVAFAMIVFNWAHQFGELIAASFLFGIGGGISMPALMAIAVIKGEQRRAMGSVMALLTLAHSFGMLSGAVLAGMMMDVYQLRHAFPVGSGLMIMGIGSFLMLTYPRLKPPS